jgi:prepilin-type N-terminal cleavage/methylation domain-containing protein
MTRANDSRGFTLVELLVAIVILGVLSVAIAAAFTVLARSMDGTQERLTESRGPKLVGLYWVPDVNSSETVNPSGATCGTVGTTLVSFLWSDDRTGNLLATWSVVTAGSTSSLVRTRCTVTDGVVSSPVQTTKVAPNIDASSTQVRCGSPLAACTADSQPDRVVLTLKTGDGRSFDVAGTRKVD